MGEGTDKEGESRKLEMDGENQTRQSLKKDKIKIKGPISQE